MGGGCELNVVEWKEEVREEQGPRALGAEKGGCSMEDWVWGGADG